MPADSPPRLPPGRVTRLPPGRASADIEPGSGADPARRVPVGRHAYERILREWPLSIVKIGR
jgi:hypothetical protein